MALREADKAASSSPSSQWAWADQAVPCTLGRVPMLSDTASLASSAAIPRCRRPSAGMPRLMDDPPTAK